MQYENKREEDAHVFLYGIKEDELDLLTNPFFLVALIEEELGHPLALVN